MKKILAALLAVVMIVSCMSVAFADTTTAYVMQLRDGNDRARVKITSEVKAGDKISFWVKPVLPDGTEAVGADMYARIDSSSNAAYYLDAEGNKLDKTVYSGQTLSKFALKTTEDGWYYIECEASAGVASGYELSVDGTNVAGKKLGACLIADVKVNGVAVDVVEYDSGNAPQTQTVEIVPVVEETPAETEDAATEDAPVEETGVVSIAVVAVAAVIGGAVVLKKREF